MNRILVASILPFAFAANAFASTDGCSIAEVMKAVHQNRTYRHYEYASDYYGNQGAPTRKQNESIDQYLFWVDDNGQTCPAIVTYESGDCARGTAVVKTGECQ